MKNKGSGEIRCLYFLIYDGIPESGNDGGFVLVVFGRLHLLPLSLPVGFCGEVPVGVLQRILACRGGALGADCSRLMSASFGRVAVIVVEP